MDAVVIFSKIINQSAEYLHIFGGNLSSNETSKRNETCGPQLRSPQPGSYLYYISVYVFPIWLLVGMLGNALILLILRSMKQKNKYFLAAMAVSDFFYFIPMFLLSLNAYDVWAADENFQHFAYHGQVPIVALANWFSTASIWFVVLIAVERLLVIRNPLSIGLVSNNTQAVLIIVFVFVVSAAIQTPRFYGYSIMYCFYEGRKVFYFLIHQGGININALRVARVFFISFLTTIIPTVLLVFLNLYLIYYIRLSAANVVKFGLVNRPEGRSDTEKKVTRLVMIILVTFLLFNMPSAVISFLTIVETDQERLTFLLGLPVQTSNNLVTLNKVLNFFLYFCSSSQFRRKFKSVWRKVSQQPTVRLVIRRTSSIVLSLKSRTSLTKTNEPEIEAFKEAIEMYREAHHHHDHQRKCDPF